MSADAIIVIPARLASTRLAEKLLLSETGKTVLRHTYEAACRAKLPKAVYVAVDHPRLMAEVESFGGHAVMTDPNCPSGTDRIASAIANLPPATIVVNVQGDEPEIDVAAIDRVIELLVQYPTASIATIATPIRDTTRLNNPNCVKIAMGSEHRALYFSRSPIPFVRDGVTDELLAQEPPLFWHHLGLYGYRTTFLRRFATLAQGRLEKLEKLEQLRALEAGETIVVGRVDGAPPGIDTLDDYRAFVARMATAGKN